MIAAVLSVLLATTITDCPREEKRLSLDIDYRVVTDTEFGAETSLTVRPPDTRIEINAGAAGKARRARITLRNVQGEIVFARTKCVQVRR